MDRPAREGGFVVPHLHTEVTIDRPVEEVFSYISNPRNEAHWLSSVSQTSNVSDGPTHPGTTYETLSHFLGRRMEFNVEVVEFEPPKQYGYRATHGALHIHRRIHLEPVDGGATRLTMDLEAEGHHNVLRLAEDVMLRAGQRQGQSGLENLKDILETHGPDHPRHDR
jgi:uncharacterized protein YndB with AHSA1/START domain